MSFQKNSLKVKVWLYLALFSCILLVFLWLFQIAFLDDYYEWSKRKDLNKTANSIVENFDEQHIDSTLNMIAFKNGVCIEVLLYTITNSFLKNKMLVYGLKLDEQTYIFVSASLEPLDATIKILSTQLIYVTFIVLILSFVIAYYISRKISEPIIELNDSAKKCQKEIIMWILKEKLIFLK